jgi:hypothetical protein
MEFFILLFALPGLWFVTSYFLEMARSHRYGSFPITEGIITSLELKSKKGRVRTWIPVIEYTFQVNGVTFTGNRLTFSGVVVEEEIAIKIRKLFAVGNPVQVHFNPRNPADCVLNPSGADLNNRLILGVILTVIALIIFLILITT